MEGVDKRKKKKKDENRKYEKTEITEIKRDANFRIQKGEMSNYRNI